MGGGDVDVDDGEWTGEREAADEEEEEEKWRIDESRWNGGTADNEGKCPYTKHFVAKNLSQHLEKNPQESFEMTLIFQL